MAVPTTKPTGTERYLSPDEFIVSKTDKKGVITYVNRTFCKLAGYTEDELLGQAHNCIRHPDMPRCVFKLLWEQIQKKQEVFAYVVNLCKNGDHYWVFAHVTASLDERERILGYHSNRRSPDREALNKILPIYKALLEEESKHSNPRQAAEAGFALLLTMLEGLETSYDELIFSLSKEV